jgi:hypothetical protein
VTVSGPTERVIELLTDAGYDVVAQPQQVGGIPFEFAAMLAGRSSLDLIALVDLAVDTDDVGIRRRVEGLARALDLVRSRRSLTIILVGPRRGLRLIQGLAGVARVLTVGSPGTDDAAGLRDALAVLLPLEVATENDDAADAWATARMQMNAKDPSETGRALAASVSGKAAVQNALHDILSEPIEIFYEAEGDVKEEGV